MIAPAVSVSQVPLSQAPAPVSVAASAEATPAVNFAGILQAITGEDVPAGAAHAHTTIVHSAKAPTAKVVVPPIEDSAESGDDQPKTPTQTSIPVQVAGAFAPPVPATQDTPPSQPISARIQPVTPDAQPVIVAPVASAPEPPLTPAPPAGKVSKSESKPASTEKTATALSVAVVVPQVIEPKPRPQPPAPSTGSAASVITPSSPTDTAPAAASHAPAVEVKVHFDNDPPPPAPIAVNQPVVSIPAVAEKPHVAVIPQVPLAAATSNAAPPATAAVPQTHDMRAARYEQPAVVPTTRAEAVLPEETKASPQLRSLALEFTPDGSQDVRLRLTEHAGDVHISLHSSDPSLAGRLSDGVQDLVGSLSHAGYDAQAWTSDQHQRNQQQQNPEEQTKTRRGSTGDADFNELIDQKEFA